jgi:uncharacterized protein YjiS (DUF1127 family)
MATITMADRERLRANGASPSARTLRIALGAAAQALSTTLMIWHERACERRQLLGLGDAALKDFGATPADAACEAEKPFWRG